MFKEKIMVKKSPEVKITRCIIKMEQINTWKKIFKDFKY